MVRKFFFFALECVPYLMASLIFIAIGYVLRRDGFTYDVFIIATLGFGFMLWIKCGVCESPRHNDVSEQNTDDLFGEWENMNNVLRAGRTGEGD